MLYIYVHYIYRYMCLFVMIILVVIIVTIITIILIWTYVLHGACILVQFGPRHLIFLKLLGLTDLEQQGLGILRRHFGGTLDVEGYWAATKEFGNYHKRDT